MKRVAILSIIGAIILLLGFKADNECKIPAKITRFCGLKDECSWGWSVKIGEKSYRCSNLGSYGITYNDSSLRASPIEVLIDYEILNEGCSNHINVTCLTKVQNQPKD